MSADIAQLAAAHAELLRHLGDVIRSLWNVRMLQTLQTELGQHASAIAANILVLQTFPGVKADGVRLRPPQWK